MKATDIRNMSLEEMKQKASDVEQEMFNLRFQHGTGQLENSAKLKQTRREVARLKTIIRQTETEQ
jgi:large subunit ribosomal protein L29